MDTINKGFIVSGFYALLGIYFANKLIFLYHYGEEGISLLPVNFFEILLFALAKFFFILSLITVYIIAKKDMYYISLKKRLYFVVPLFVGFVIIFLLMNSNYVEYIFSLSLIIYALVLVNLNRVSLSNLSYLAGSIIIVGVLSLLVVNNRWLFLALGFGVFPIVFGIVNILRTRS